MINFKEDKDIINSSERALEHSQASKLPQLTKIPNLKAEVTIERIKNFTCPACKETLEEAVSINGAIRGWCGRSHSYIKQAIGEV